MPAALFSVRRERWLLLILAGIQFTHIMDFMVLAPLGPQFMRLFNISAREFSMLVSSYMFTAAIVGLIAAFYIDRFDRRTALLWAYGGFGVATLLCALAPNFHVLLITRAITGAFGGVLSAIVFSIVSDMIPEARRGAAMALGEGASGLSHPPPALIVGQHCGDLRHQFVGIADGQRRAAGNGFARRVGKIPR